MDKKQLFKTALISSPIMAAFEISPIFFLRESQPRFSFWQMMLVLTVFSLVVWTLNIRLITVKETKRPGRHYLRYVFSYLLTLILALVIAMIGHFFQYKKGPEAPSPLFLILNIAALNTIVLILSDTILMRTKKMQTEVELANFKVRSLEAEHQQLIQQLQPHFLFNAMSTLKSLIRQNVELAEDYVVKLSGFLRFTIAANENSIIPLSEELQFTSDYIDLQKIRFSGTFNSEILIPKEITTSYKIPVYALQTLVENAIKHNAFTKKRPLHLNITYKDEMLTVSNNKIPKPNGKHEKGVGLKNLDKRYSIVANNALVIKETDDVFSVQIKLLK